MGENIENNNNENNNNDILRLAILALLIATLIGVVQYSQQTPKELLQGLGMETQIVVTIANVFMGAPLLILFFI